MKASCIIVSAGRGKRLGSAGEKPFVKLGKKTVLAHSIEVFERSSFIDDIIVVVSRDRIKKCASLVRKYGYGKVCAIVAGGRRRCDSARLGLEKTRASSVVLIHDGARPLVDKKLVRRVFEAAKKFGAALAAVPARPTIKRAGRRLFVRETPERKFLWEAQTPQGFRKEIIARAYKKAKNRNATDDASLVERLGKKVKIVMGSYRNIKITTPEDLALARLLMENSA